MKKNFLSLYIWFSLTLMVLAKDNLYSKNVVLGEVAGHSVLSTALARADVALSKSVITASILKGEIAEKIASNTLLSQLNLSGGWINVAPRVGPQGIDGIALKVNSNGLPTRLIVSEVKYGTSQLNKVTRDGIQLGRQWTDKRLIAMGNRYTDLASLVKSGMKQAKMPTGIQGHSIPIKLKNGEEIIFWRKGSKDAWKYQGNRNCLPEASQKLNTYGKFFIANGKGLLSYKKYLYQCVFEKNILKVTIKDASRMTGANDIASLNKIGSFEVNMASKHMAKMGKFAQEEISDIIRRKIPALSKSESDIYAKNILKNAKDYQNLVSSENYPSVYKVMAQNSIKAGIIGSTIVIGTEVTFQLVNDGKINYMKLGKTGGVAFVSISSGVAVGQLASLSFTKNQILHSFAQSTAKQLGVQSASLVTNAISRSISGIFSSCLFAYGGYYLGLHDIDTANKQFVAGAVGTIVGELAHAATISLIMTFGTASTGTPISTLGGIAATNAVSAWLGGGSIAAGGGGMALGGIIIVSGTVIIIAATTVAIIWGWQLYDAYKEKERTDLTIQWLRNKYNVN